MVRSGTYNQSSASVKGANHVVEDQEAISGNWNRWRIIASANELRSNRWELRRISYTELNSVGRCAICRGGICNPDIVKRIELAGSEGEGQRVATRYRSALKMVELTSCGWTAQNLLTFAGTFSQSVKKTFEGDLDPIETAGSAPSMFKKKDPLTVALTGVLELQNTGGSTRRAIGAGTKVNKSSLLFKI